jgi:hypothetical protein
MKKIPVGAWILALDLDEKVTEESLQLFLRDCGVDLPLENISVNQTAKGTSALVSIDNDMGAGLVNWAINKATLEGRAVSFSGWEARGKAYNETGIGYYSQKR